MLNTITLYHYTTSAGLKGILESKAFWASDYRFLNDISEFQYGWGIISSEIQRKERAIRSISASAWEILNEFVAGIERSEVHGFVASLTTEGDLLSQWRGYNGGKGYAIGINADWLNENAKSQEFQLFPVLYSLSKQKKAAADVIHLLLDKLKNVNDPSREWDATRQWLEDALKVALSFKSAHFREELEYRLVYSGLQRPVGIQVRPSAIGLVPYLPCHFDKVRIKNPIFHPNNLGLEHIVVGPALDSQQTCAVDALLTCHRMRIRVTKSAIPYMAD